jgi:predicted nuclease of predicted toxin-antitoxin system
VPPPIRFLLDNCVPDSVGEVLRLRGHTVVHVRDILPVDSSDPLVATVSEEDDAVLVSCDRDFRLIAPRIPRGQRARYRRLSRIALECNEPQAADRIKSAITLIEAEFEIAQNSKDKRMNIVIQNNGIKTLR